MSDTTTVHNNSQITPAIVAKMAYLARLAKSPQPEFLDKYSRELGAILDYVAELNQVDISQVTDVIGSARVVTMDDLAADEPEVSPDEYQRIRANIIANFPNKQGDLLILPGIFEN